LVSDTPVRLQRQHRRLRATEQKSGSLLAYGRIYANHGAMTPGVTQETVDGMSQAKIGRIIAAMRHERYRFTPVRRVHIPKKNGKTRPLGLPTTSWERWSRTTAATGTSTTTRRSSGPCSGPAKAWPWKGSDLGMIDGATELTSVYLEGARQHGTLEGSQACVSLESLTIVNFSVESTSPLGGLDLLSRAELHAAKPTPPHAPSTWRP
jgi:hypothetical protein